MKPFALFLKREQKPDFGDKRVECISLRLIRGVTREDDREIISYFARKTMNNPSSESLPSSCVRLALCLICVERLEPICIFDFATENAAFAYLVSSTTDRFPSSRSRRSLDLED